MSETLNVASYLKFIVFVLHYVSDENTDNSKKICEKFTNQVYSGAWEYEGDRRNYGIEKCSSEWILEIDADEHISKKS